MKGVWVWGTPIKGKTSTGQEIDILVLDTEGLGSTDVDKNHDNRIFSMALLLSSLFIYNSVGNIDENALNDLSLVVNITKNIKVKSNTSFDEPDSEDYAKHLPAFLWVVRDFSLQLINAEGDPITSNQYLDLALTPQKGFSDDIEQKNRIRRLISSFFKERECVTLVRPFIDEQDLQSFENKELDELRPEFREQALNLKTLIFQNVKPKQLYGKNLTGDLYCELINSYVEAINKGAVPNIETSWIYICKQQCIKSLEEGLACYDSFLKDDVECQLPMDPQKLNQAHGETKKLILEKFRSDTHPDERAEYEQELLKQLKKKYRLIKAKNEAICSVTQQ